jgi:hypothetical protein
MHNSRIKNINGLIEFMDEFKDFWHYEEIEIVDKNLIAGLNAMTRKDVLMPFDCEFYMVHDDDQKYMGNNSNLVGEVSPFVREFGMLLFVADRETNGWFFYGSLHLNFPSPIEFGIKHDRLKYVSSDYSDVTNITREKMKLNDKIFMDMEFINSYIRDCNIDEKKKAKKLDYFSTKRGRILHEIYRDRLKHKYVKIFDDQIDLYTNDPLVRKRSINKIQTKTFLELMNIFQESTTFLVKGKQDFKALCNDMKLLQIECNMVNGNDSYDIEIFNRLSQQLFGQATLEATYHGLIECDEYKLIKKSLDKLVPVTEIRAHNPVFDSYFTFVVAITINIILLNKLA